MNHHRIKKALAIILFGLLCLRASAIDPAKPATSVDELQQRIAEIISPPLYQGALWGIKVTSLDSHKTLFETNASLRFTPASNMKLYTMACVLDQLGPDYRIRTSLYAKAKPNWRGTLKGDLIVYGRGDPTINERLHNDDIYEALEPLLEALTNAGVKRITGDLIGDESYFHGPPFGSGWNWSDLQASYGAEISALTINDNSMDLLIDSAERVGLPCPIFPRPGTGFLTISNQTRTEADGEPRGINFYRPLGGNLVYVSGQLPLYDSEVVTLSVHNPAELFVRLFREALARNHIIISGRVRSVNWKDRQTQPLDLNKWTELGALESLPLRDIMPQVLKPSNNLYADLMLAHAGRLLLKDWSLLPGATSEQIGLAGLRKFVSKAGIAPGEALFEEGSGLSRDNLVTPNATVTLLEYMSYHRYAEVFTNTLSVAGVDGTLSSRMRDTPAAGNIRAKTGSLHWANALSGYVTSAAGEHLVFSIMLNRFYNPAPDRPNTTDLDAIAIALASFTGRTAE